MDFVLRTNKPGCGNPIQTAQCMVNAEKISRDLPYDNSRPSVPSVSRESNTQHLLTLVNFHSQCMHVGCAANERKKRTKSEHDRQGYKPDSRTLRA